MAKVRRSPLAMGLMVALFAGGGQPGQLGLYNDAGAADVLLDVTGYFYPLAG